MGGGSGWEYSNVSVNDVGERSEFDWLIWKLQALCISGTNSLFLNFICVLQHHRPKVTPQIPEKKSDLFIIMDQDIFVCFNLF